MHEAALRDQVRNRWVDEAGCHKRFAVRNLGKACVENSCHQSKCHQLVEIATDGTEMSPAAEPGSNDQAPLAHVGFYCGGEVDLVQFQVLVRRGGWTIRRELMSMLIR